MGIIFDSVPAGTINRLPEQERDAAISSIVALPKKVQVMIFSLDTGAYIRGLTKQYEVKQKDIYNVARVILLVTIGNVDIAQMAGRFSSDIPMAHDRAEKMAKEIQEELFAPVMNELREYWSKQKQASRVVRRTSPPPPPNPKNVINLKDK